MARKRVGSATTQDTSANLQQAVRELEELPDGYPTLLEEIKGRIRTAQIKAALSVNRELITLYWEIGRSIVERQMAEGCGEIGCRSPGPGSAVRVPRHLGVFTIQHVADAVVLRRLGRAKSRTTCARNGTPDSATGCGRNSWGHNITLIEKLKDPAERLWYAQQTVKNGGSRNVLVHQIEPDLYHRQGGAISNFHATLPAPQSDLAHQLLKDPYTFDFLMLTHDAQERELERGLIEHIQKFLLELGIGFAFVGRQYHLDVGDEDFYLDLLFYHLQLRCYVVIELKAEKFKPEFAGKMNFYLSVVDDLLRHSDDQPSIGLIICKEKNRVIVEYALRGTGTPVGVSEYAMSVPLPESLKGVLPSVEQIEAEIADARKA